MYTLNCQWCKRDFQSEKLKKRGEIRKYCSQSCASKAKAATPEYVAKVRDGRKRGLDKANATRKANAAATRQIESVCEWCKKYFIATRTLGTRIRRTCSAECQRKMAADHTNFKSPSYLAHRRKLVGSANMEPLHRPDVQSRRAASCRRRGFGHLDGGQRKGPTIPQQLLMDRLPGWVAEYAIKTGYPKSGGEFACRYFCDLAEPATKVAVEVDGATHGSKAVKARDAKKTLWLESHGWVVLRFRNWEVTANPDEIASKVLALAATRKEQHEATQV